MCLAYFSLHTLRWLHFSLCLRSLCPGRNGVKRAAPANKPSLSKWARPCFVDFICSLTNPLAICDTGWSCCQAFLMAVTPWIKAFSYFVFLSQFIVLRMLSCSRNVYLGWLHLEQSRRTLFLRLSEQSGLSSTFYRHAFEDRDSLHTRGKTELPAYWMMVR